MHKFGQLSRNSAHFCSNIFYQLCRAGIAGAQGTLAICEGHREDETFSPKLLSFVGNNAIHNPVGSKCSLVSIKNTQAAGERCDP